jgi:uracil-DNA glycosylase
MTAAAIAHAAAATESRADSLEALLARVRACRLCAGALPLGPRPTLRASITARLLVVGQAPGTRVHETGLSWNDASGERLRGWLGLDRARFYDESRVALVSTGLCYPGRLARGGDAPPRPECAPRWHPPLRAAMPEIGLTLLIGHYAQAYRLGRRRKATMTETVRAFEEYLPEFLPLPHPSWRTTKWERDNPWFGAELVPELRRRVRELTAQPPASMRSMSSSLKPRWWPISWTSTCRTSAARSSPVSHQ